MRVALCMLVLVTTTAGAADDKRTHRPSDAVRGKELYDRHCQQCHGARAMGDGAATARLVADVPPLKGVVTEANLAKFVTSVLDGKGAMPGYSESFDAYDARRVLRHLVRASQQTGTTEQILPGAAPQKGPPGPPPPSIKRDTTPPEQP